MRRRLIVFARLPRLGRVKTRLAATVGEARALDAHRRLLDATIAIAQAAGPEVLELRHADDRSPPTREAASLLRALAERGWRIAPQRGPDLGARMRGALEAALADGDLPVLVGSDCPALRAVDLLDAFAALSDADAVFAPAEDGGYALVGLARPAAGLFDGIPWGTSRVMAATLERARVEGLRTCLLRTVWDVDVEDDLRRWEAQPDQRDRTSGD
jgi:rSAM/selenodomain-associated transferase 1